MFSRLFLGCLILSNPAFGRAIQWGNAIGNTNLTSDGSKIDGAFVFELGYFERSPGLFDAPSEENVSEWAWRWRVFDRAMYAELAGYFTSSAQVRSDETSSSSSADPQETFPVGTQAYVWIHNSLVPGNDTEWLLFTNDDTDGNPGDDWLFPAHDSLSPGAEAWRVSGATSVIWGRLGNARNSSNNAPILVGGGERSVAPTSFSAQTFRAPSPIPEPSTALLASLGCLLAQTLRRRGQRTVS